MTIHTSHPKLNRIHIVVASVWLVHGLYNKLLGGSPRHLAIVQSIPGLNGATGELALTIAARSRCCWPRGCFRDARRARAQRHRR